MADQTMRRISLKPVRARTSGTLLWSWHSACVLKQQHSQTLIRMSEVTPSTDAKAWLRSVALTLMPALNTRPADAFESHWLCNPPMPHAAQHLREPHTNHAADDVWACFRVRRAPRTIVHCEL